MPKDCKPSTIRIGLACLTLLLAVTSFQSGAVPANAAPTAPTGDAFSENENFVFWVYNMVLFREPDDEGFAYWTDQVEQDGTGPFVHAIVESQEWREVWVNEFYLEWLDREADDGGLAFWSSYLAGKRFDRFESFLGGSDEAYDYSGGEDDVYIDYVYFLAAFREPTTDEIAAGLVALQADPRSDFVYSVLHSEDGLAARVWIAYAVTLDREPDTEGAGYWADFYNGTGDFSQMLGGMLLSDEAWEAAQEQPTIQAPNRAPFKR